MDKMKEKYQPVIGLEIHIELKTKSKMFCQCLANYFKKSPNSNVCPVCLGLPGALPVPNKKAIEWTVLVGLALNCKINQVSKFDRKHYFYPDLPKGYQISQYDQPFAVNGYLSFLSNLGKNEGQFIKKKFRIRRVHLEEDTGKLIHTGTETLIDFNRSGVPLIEIVTEPDFDNSEDVKRFLEELQVLIKYLDVSDADMEKGSMRLEPNISVRLVSKKVELPKYKVEIKNINSFRFVKQAIDYEIQRQIDLFESGKPPIQETRGYDAKTGKTFGQRIKEEAHDYRYFPEPDIPPIILDNQWLKEISDWIPELPNEKIKRFINNYKLRFNEAFLLTRDKKISEFYEKSLLQLKPQLEKFKLNIKDYPQVVANLITNKKISLDLDLDEFVKRVTEFLRPKAIDKKLLEETINKVVGENERAVSDYKKGKTNALMFLVGQVMKELKGQAKAQEVIETIRKKLNNK